MLLVYPLIGMVVRLAWQTRQRRLAQVKQPPSVGVDHSGIGRWLATAVVLIVLVALTVVIATKVPTAQFAGGLPRAMQLLLVLLGALVSLAALLLPIGGRQAGVQPVVLGWGVGSWCPAGGLAPVGQSAHPGVLAIPLLVWRRGHRADAVLPGGAA